MNAPLAKTEHNQGLNIRAFILLIFVFALTPAWGHDCGDLNFEPVMESSVLLELFGEYRSMSYVSQTAPGRDPRRTVRANPALLSESKKLTKNEIEFIRGQERKFHLNDDEIADFYFVKIVGEIQTQKTRMLALAARDNFWRHLKTEPSRDQVRRLQAALRLINWDFEFIGADDLENAKHVLEQPLRQFDGSQLRLIISHGATQSDLMAAGIDSSATARIAQIIVDGPPNDPTACCRAFVDTVPCVGCGLNVGYHQLEQERAKKGMPVFPVAPKNAPVPERLFLYLGGPQSPRHNLQKSVELEGL